MAPDKVIVTTLRSIFDEPYDPPEWGWGKQYGKRPPPPSSESALESVMNDYTLRFSRLAKTQSQV